MTISKPGVKPVYVALLFACIVMMAACSKKENISPADDEATTGGIPFYKIQRVENLYISQIDTTDPNQVQAEILYSLEQKKIQPARLAKTTEWDVSFSGMFASFLGGNNNTDPTNTGHRGSGKGGIAIIEKNFEDVVSIPTEFEFKTAQGAIGSDEAGNFGTGVGWYLYDFSGTTVGNGAVNKRHVAYALGNPLALTNGTTLPARTIILRTANGNFAKIKIISCYQDTVDPREMYSSRNLYFTFEYVLVPASSTQFTVKS